MISGIEIKKGRTIYPLDREAANDSHYYFTDEVSIRTQIYKDVDENRLFDEIMIRYVKEFGGGKLLLVINPYITEQLHG